MLEKDLWRVEEMNTMIFDSYRRKQVTNSKRIRKYWIFIVDDRTFPEHLHAGIASINRPKQIHQQQSAIAEIIGVRPGDYIFFNLRASKGRPPLLYGLYEATSTPYYDESPLYKEAQYVGKPGYAGGLPYRVGFKHIINFPKPIRIDEIWYLRESGHIWTLHFSRGDAVGVHACVSVSKPEGELLVKMLEAINLGLVERPKVTQSLLPEERVPIINMLDLRTDKLGQLHYEASLKALLINGLADGMYKDVFGYYDDFIPNLPTGTRKELDIVLLKYCDDSIVWYELLELTAGTFDMEHLKRLYDYEEWFLRGRKVLAPLQVHPVGIAYDFNDDVIKNAKARFKEGKNIKLIRYRFDKEDRVLCFKELSLS